MGRLVSSGMNAPAALLRCSLLAPFILLAACTSSSSPTPNARPSADADEVRIETQPKPTDEARVEKDPPLAEPEVKADPSDPASGRNKGFGPYDSLDAICGATKERCQMSEPVELRGSKTITRMATWIELPIDGSRHLAFETKDGWYVSAVPDGEVFGALGHHSPAGTHFYLEQAKVDGDGVVLLRSYGQSVFIPGRGSSGSSSVEEVLRMKCAVVDDRVACGAGKLVFSRSCHDNDCKEVGVHPVAAK